MTHSSAVNVFHSDIKMTALLNLSVTDKIVSYSLDCDNVDRVSMKLMIIMWNNHEEVRIDCMNS